MATTRLKTGLRIPGACGKAEPLETFAGWCKASGFDSLDLGGGATAAQVQVLRDAGLIPGTVDLGGTGGLLAADEATRRTATETCLKNVNAIADAGADKAFCVFYPADSRQSRRDSFGYWKEAFAPVAQEAEKRGVRIAVEGWPGPNDSALGVTPESLRAMFAAIPSEAFGINYDPSHLIRVGVDYRRFLHEFAHRVVHAHGKDTALDTEGAYLYGNLGPTFDKTVGFGGGDWRYTIPGEGFADWGFICARLSQAGFDGVVSVELEDFRYNGTVEGEKTGLLRAREHLARFV